MNHAVLASLNPEQVEVELGRADELEVRRRLSSELDEIGSYVAWKSNPRWLWHGIDHRTGKVLAYVFGRRKDEVRMKRLVRRTICFSKTEQMHDWVIGLFVNRYEFGLLLGHGINRFETPSSYCCFLTSASFCRA